MNQQTLQTQQSAGDSADLMKIRDSFKLTKNILPHFSDIMEKRARRLISLVTFGVAALAVMPTQAVAEPTAEQIREFLRDHPDLTNEVKQRLQGIIDKKEAEQAAAQAASKNRIPDFFENGKNILFWNLAVDQFAKPFLEEFSKDAADNKCFEETRVKHLVLERKTRRAVTVLKPLFEKKTPPDQASFEKAEGIVAANQIAIQTDDKKIGEIMTKVIKQVTKAAKSEKNPAKKKEMLDKAKKAEDGWFKWKDLNEKAQLPTIPGTKVPTTAPKGEIGQDQAGGRKKGPG